MGNDEWESLDGHVPGVQREEALQLLPRQREEGRGHHVQLRVVSRQGALRGLQRAGLAELSMGFLITLAILVALFFVYAVYNTVQARQQTELEIAGTRSSVLQRIDGYFGRTWARDPGPGDLNLRPCMRWQEPTLSVDVIEIGPNRCGVSIWVSRWHAPAFVMNHGQLARRKKNGLAAHLRRSGAVSDPPRAASL